jgi:argininosuccinate lyase
MSGDKLWGGRFTGNTDKLMEEFNASIGFDIRLFEADIRGNLAQAKALREAGVLSDDEYAAIVSGLEQVRQEIEDGTYRPGPELEDIHMAIEHRLTQIVGPAGAKIHTGRSRNDQVNLDVRLYLKDALGDIAAGIAALQGVIVDRADTEIDTFLPGYTHLQQAQPLRLGHYLMALFWMLQRDRERVSDSIRRMDRMPLGAGALAGSGFPVDRELLCRELGFSAPTENSIDAVTDRDFLVESVSAICILLTHLSRFSEDWIIWASQEFRFVEIDDAFATGSSMMPQKKNPDSLELIRGKTGRAYGDLMTLLTIQKGLPLTYGKDLQEDKEPLFDALDTAAICLGVFAGVASTSRFNSKRMRDAIDPGLYATDIADMLVTKGMPFRDAHKAVGTLVARAAGAGVPLTQLPLEIVHKDVPDITAEDLAALTPEAATERRGLPGGTGRDSVVAQIAQGRQLIEEIR